MKTFQDFIEAEEKSKFVLSAIMEHKRSDVYRIAFDAEEYSRQRNVTINSYQKLLYTLSGKAVPDNFSANHKVASNFFERFIVQQNQYLLGNGLYLDDDANKAKLGADFDARLQEIGHAALVEGVAFGFWNLDHLEVFKLTEFVPLYDENTGALRAGIRFWQIDRNKPLRCTLYEVDGYQEFIANDKANDLRPIEEKKTYKQTVVTSIADGERIVDGENYDGFPIVPLWGSPLKQSALVGMRQAIDAFDLIRSGFANDLDDASMIYWTLQNADGMDDIDLAKFVERMKTVKAAAIDGDGAAQAHTIDVPYASRVAYLERLEQDMTRDFCALDINSLSAGNKTATEINAAYQPFDNKVDQYEYCILDFLGRLFELVGIVNETPVFVRSRIVNRLEETQMVLSAANYLDDETILRKLPFLTPDEIDGIMERKITNDMQIYGADE